MPKLRLSSLVPTSPENLFEYITDRRRQGIAGANGAFCQPGHSLLPKLGPVSAALVGRGETPSPSMGEGWDEGDTPHLTPLPLWERMPTIKTGLARYLAHRRLRRNKFQRRVLPS